METTPNKDYIEIERKWKKGDQIALDFPMQVRQVMADNKVENLQQHIALEYGPFVYCAEQVDNLSSFDSIKLSADDEYQVDLQPDFLGGIHQIQKKNANGVYTFIPYYAWANRGVNKMKVWFQQL